MAEPLDNQMDTLRLSSKEEKEDETLQTPSFFGPSAVDIANDYTKGEAIAFATKLGTLDTFRGAKQLIGFDRVHSAREQRKLKALMENEEFGDEVKYAYYGGMILDPVAWLLPAAKVAQAGKLGYKVGKTAWGGVKSGAVAGYLGYVDEDTSDRLIQSAGGAVTGGVLAPVFGIGGKKAVEFIKGKSSKELIDNAPKIAEDIGGPQPQLSSSIKSVFYTPFQTGKSYYQKGTTALTRQVFNNPIPSIGAFASYLVADTTAQSIAESQAKPGDLDSGLMSQGMIGMMSGLATAIPTFLAGKKFISRDSQIAQKFGRAFIDNFEMDKGYIQLKKNASNETRGFQSEIADIVVEARQLSKKSPEANRLLYYLLDGRLTDRQLTKQAKELGKEGELLLKVSKDARAKINDIGSRMVDIGILDENTWNTNLNKYIHRTYLRLDRDPKTGQKLSAAQKEARKIEVARELNPFGKELLARGKRGTLYEAVNPLKNPNKVSEEFKEKIKQGYEVLGTPKKTSTGNYEVNIRRQLTLDERKNLGELEDGAYAIAETGKLMTNDLAVYKFYNDVAKQFGVAKKDWQKLPKEQQIEYKLVPNTKLRNSDIPQWGNLNGMYLPKNMYDDIYVTKIMYENVVNQRGPFIQNTAKFYNKANSAWKRSKTSWNPVVHFNNTTSNFFLLDAHDVPVSYLMKYGSKIWTKKGRQALSNDPVHGDINKDILQFGLYDASFARSELGLRSDSWMKPHLIAEKKAFLKSAKQESINTFDVAEYSRTYVNGLMNLTTKAPRWFDRSITDIYGKEDAMFRVALYVNRLDKFMPDLQKAVDEGTLVKGSEKYLKELNKIKELAAADARKSFIDYDIQAPAIRFLRGAPLPFVSYSYRIIPILAEIATTKPHKFLKWAGLGYALNYAGREKSAGEEKEERDLMTARDKGRMFGIPLMPRTMIKVPDSFGRAFSLGQDTDPVTGRTIPKRSYYYDITRSIPGGDVLQATPEGSSARLPFLPAPFQPSFGMLGEILLPFMLGIDPFSGKAVPELQVSGTYESLGAKSKFVAQRLIPNNPLITTFGDVNSFSSWSYKKIYRSINEIDNIYSETLPVSLAVAQTLGIKLWPFEPVKRGRKISAEFNRQRSIYDKQIKKLLRQKAMGQITTERATEEIIKIRDKMEKQYLKYYKPQIQENE